MKDVNWFFSKGWLWGAIYYDKGWTNYLIYRCGCHNSTFSFAFYPSVFINDSGKSIMNFVVDAYTWIFIMIVSNNNECSNARPFFLNPICIW